MEYVSPSPERDEQVARRMAEHEDLIRHCDIRLLGLAAPAPSPQWLGSSSIVDGVVESVGLVYGDLRRGSVVQVHTLREPGFADPYDLLDVEFDRLGSGDRPAVVTGRTSLLVDGRRREAELFQAGPRLWAARCPQATNELIVVARDWTPAATRLVAVPDVEPFIDGRRAHLVKVRGSSASVATRSIDVRHAHRALVEACLNRSAELTATVRAGRRPVRWRGAERYGELWSAAVRAQMHLSEQSRETADEAVAALVNQLTGLQEKATWFADPQLREAALNESMIYWTGLSERVPSLAAQQAWRRVWIDHRHERRAWLDAWSDWARRRVVKN